MQQATVLACAAQGRRALVLLALAGLAGASHRDNSVVLRAAPRRILLAGERTGAATPRGEELQLAAAAVEEVEETPATGGAGVSLMETGASTTLTQEHLRVLTNLVEEKLRVSPSSTLAGISSMLKSVKYSGAGHLCLDFASLGAAPTTPTVTTTTTKMYDTLPGTYDGATFTCPPSAANLGDLTCAGWGGSMPWKHYIHFSQAQKPQLSLYDCAKMCQNSAGCRYYWWQVVLNPKAQAVCSLIHDTKEHSMTTCTSNPIMSFPWGGQPSSAVYCPLVLNTRNEIGSGSLTCSGPSPTSQKDCIYKIPYSPSTVASPAAATAR